MARPDRPTKQIIDTKDLPIEARRLLKKRGKAVEKHRLIIDPTKTIIRVYQRYWHPNFGYLYEEISKKVV